MAHDDSGYKISAEQASLMSFEAIEEADVVHWINDPNGPGILSRSNSTNESELYSSPSERTELYNGRILLVLTSSGFWWSQGFDLESCEENLARFGVQVPPEDYELPIRASLMSTEVRRYMYFSSTGFMMLLAPVFYLAVWCCLFSTFHLYLDQYVKSFFWAFCLLISTISVLLTTILLLLLHRHNQKINVNTDMRLIWANENLVKHNILVGVLDVTKHCTSMLHLCFVYFDVKECERRLASLLEERHQTGSGFQSLLNQKLGHLCIVIETNQSSPLTNIKAESEETPLLGNDEDSRRNSNQQTQHVFNTLTCLVPKGTAKEVAYQLLVTYSGLYVKLLASQQLPFTKSSIHTKDAQVPCLCQYIATSILNLSNCELK
ncbi:transmembrane protein 268 isoform X1 [Chiloscyllium plagiosum]|uniref:transmembrane protein 268 isoform X1 n=1 Tax=Chiloscyllium plagiosum TaxID=36176 RepID=UPI001CB83EE0|nr:transmembrane protein 268 isoform X1 [Chiloscyllium plagiosum]XP_043534188.1 transmembrane protein 268 isoform X1 [Chiloscyllium plagiosum]XP_043534189.1 transmembrane protein 268 isoform X1 [Chiloscyllium plagiosum]XP_043534190.1 transmembrane protein 268 isoform X1 [Chiloscyllium plagiosum]XP_043534191.1 transmembrane protein 268 isoform X1 [Chiloscyllium plagiosum]